MLEWLGYGLQWQKPCDVFSMLWKKDLKCNGSKLFVFLWSESNAILWNCEDDGRLNKAASI